MADPDRPATEAMQDAALQMIAAARAFLTAAEDVVRDPSAVRDIAGTVTSMARRFMRDGAEGAAGGRDDDDDDPPIEHIEVS
jgi:hypothetical protein